MIERPGTDANAGVRRQNLTGRKIFKVNLRGKDPHWDREQRRDHHIVQHRFDTLAVQVTGPDPDFALRIVARGEEWQPADMIEMRVAIEQVEVGVLTVAYKLVTQ
jgi:hypothetical protein